QVTPLQPLPRLSERTGNQIQLIREDRQPVHYFKLRGAYYMMSQLTHAHQQAGVIAASAVNHAQGLALSGKQLGVQ
ncbi:pyridoxal-phosphate dependent enzyme, partial [Photobacterium sanguinicancri]|uniref:pyridoxal-phosphate dependent enzyme n=1 Tax=Photobacterium sanguinicancri TaxID=875932 RepID=UPI0026E16193